MSCAKGMHAVTGEPEIRRLTDICAAYLMQYLKTVFKLDKKRKVDRL